MRVHGCVTTSFLIPSTSATTGAPPIHYQTLPIAPKQPLCCPCHAVLCRAASLICLAVCVRCLVLSLQKKRSSCVVAVAVSVLWLMVPNEYNLKQVGGWGLLLLVLDAGRERGVGLSCSCAFGREGGGVDHSQSSRTWLCRKRAAGTLCNPAACCWLSVSTSTTTTTQWQCLVPSTVCEPDGYIVISGCVAAIVQTRRQRHSQ